MSETYEDIIQKINEANGSSCRWFDCMEKTCKECPAKCKSCGKTVNFDIAERVKNAVAADISKWFILDQDGKELHIGDKTNEGEVSYLGSLFGTPSMVTYDSGAATKMAFYGINVKKIEPDSWDEYRRDLLLSASQYAEKYRAELPKNMASVLAVATHRTERAKKLAEAK